MQNAMPKIYQYIIIVWSVACASGLGIFLFQVYGPRITNEPQYSAADVAVTALFWLIVWAAPVVFLAIRGRGRKE